MKPFSVLKLLSLVALVVGLGSCANGRTLRPARAVMDAITHVPLLGSAFQALPTPDGAWVLVSLTMPDAGSPGISVYRRTDGGFAFVHLAALDAAPTGMVLTHDAKLLVVAAGNRLAFLDVERLTAGTDGALLGYLDEPTTTRRGLGRVYVNVTPDDQFMFASDERARTITVINLAVARAAGFAASAIVGKIPVGNAPIDLAFSPNAKLLYTTSQSMPSKFGWPITCRPERASKDTAPEHSEGAIVIVDVERAKTEPEHSVIGIVPAGCNPVRLVLSPQGDVAYVTARGMDALLAFDTKKLLADPAHARIGHVPVGPSPVGIAVFDKGRRVVVTSSNRYAGDASDKQALFVVDATRVSEGETAVIGTIPAGAFPREMRVTADGHTLLVTNFRSKTLQVVDLLHLRLEKRRNAGTALAR